MNDQETVNALAAHPFLQGLSEAHLKAVAGCTRRVSATAGQYLGQEREPADAFYLIQSGRIAIEINMPNRGNVSIQTIGSGEVVGWSWLVPPHRWQFNARVIDPVQALALDANSLRNKCEADHDLGYQLLKRLVMIVSGRLAATRMQLLDHYR